MKVLVKKLAEGAKIPELKHAWDSGVDLYATADTTIHPGERKLLGTGISIAVPQGYEAQIRPRSGLALKNGISLVNTPGTIDAGYRGEIGVIMINHGQEPFKVEKGMRIAQMVFVKVEQPEFKIVEELDETSRGSGRFGSTGLK
ncbi:MAG: dUTP diphosphatase [Candidatus Diapherotrites archaeon]|nr:dUTP diphosphatase [Candidatus Diapherotrites archaeon]